MAGNINPIPNFDLSYATCDVYYSQRGGLFRANYDHLLDELRSLQTLPPHRLNPWYQDNVVQLLINYLLYQLPKDRFEKIFSTHTEDLTDPIEKSIRELLPILSEALLQRNPTNKYSESAFEDLIAFQAIVNTIYQLAVQSIDAPMPPLVTWSRKQKGPYTITAAKIEEKIQIPIGVVCLPPEYQNGGLLAWSVMGHEVAGHNFIHSKPGLLDELVSKVKSAIDKKLSSQLKKQHTPFNPQDVALLSEYWTMSQRIEELASDLLGILSTGPSLAIGCIGYFRGVSEDGLLKTTGPFEAQKKLDALHIQGPGTNLYLKNLSKKVKVEEPQGVLGKDGEQEIRYTLHKSHSGPHPIAALRPFAMAEAIKHTALFDNVKTGWTNLITQEVLLKEFSKEKHVKIILIDSQVIPPQKKEKVIPYQIACLSAEIAANIIMTTKFSKLGDQEITKVFNWTMKDEAQVDYVRTSYQKGDLEAPASASTSHIVAAAVIHASSAHAPHAANAEIGALFRTMKQYLVQAQRRE